MSGNIENGGSGSASGELAELTRTEASGKPVGALLDGGPKRRVFKSNPIIEELVRAAESTSDDGSGLSFVERQLRAGQRLNALSEALLFARTGRRWRRVGLDRKEAEQASEGTPKYPQVAVWGNSLDGNTLALIGAVTAALRKAGIPDEEVDAVAGEATSGDYAHVLKP